MKKSTAFWSSFLVVFSAVIIAHARAYAAGPFEFKPNWLTIVPVIAIWAALIGVILRKDLASSAARSSARKAAVARASAPVADLA